jgi:hypothetical protein
VDVVGGGGFAGADDDATAGVVAVGVGLAGADAGGPGILGVCGATAAAVAAPAPELNQYAPPVVRPAAGAVVAIFGASVAVAPPNEKPYATME